jgi:sulfur relay protein TusB/DsrH
MIASSAHTRSGMSDCLPLLGADDAVVLIEEGVLALSQPDLPALQSLKATLGATNLALFYLRDDLAARGITAPAEWQSIDINELVDLHCQYDKSLTWY